MQMKERMTGRIILALVAILSVVVITGCGGAAVLGSLIGFGSLVNNVGDLIDKIDGDDDVDPDDFEVLLDGYQIGTRPSSSGELRLNVLPTGWHLISVVTDDRKQGFHHAIRITEDHNELPLNQITPIEASSIRGTVRRATTGGGNTPVANTPVIAIRDGANLLQEGGGSPITIPPQDQGLTWVMGFTDDEGDYRMGPCQTGTWLIICGLPGFHADARIAMVQRPDDENNQDLLLDLDGSESEAALNGTVTGEGRGLANALVYTDLTSPFTAAVSADTANEVANDAGFELIDGTWFNFARLATTSTNAATYSLRTVAGIQTAIAYRENYDVGRRQVSPAAGQALSIDFDLND